MPCSSDKQTSKKARPKGDKRENAGKSVKSKVIWLSPVIRRIKRILSIIYEDRLGVYAAQSAFFISISAIPFIMLLLSVSRLVAPDLVNDAMRLIRDVIPENSREFFDYISLEIASKSQIPLISTAAVTTLWSASKGVGAVMRGVSEVYGNRMKSSFIYNILRSLLYTLIFIAIILLTLLFLVFGGLSSVINYFEALSSIFRFKTVLFFILLSVYFAVLYYIAAKGSLFMPFLKRTSKTSPKKFKNQFPGALLSAACWILFSYFYSLYIKYFPRFSYIYGSLTAVVFLMLWMYFCIYILLIGAEVNKLIYSDELKGVFGVTRVKAESSGEEKREN